MRLWWVSPASAATTCGSRSSSASAARRRAVKRRVREEEHPPAPGGAELAREPAEVRRREREGVGVAADAVEDDAADEATDVEGVVEAGTPVVGRGAARAEPVDE